MNDIPTDWIDILSDPAVRLAAFAWKKDLPETWGILSRAIKNEDFSEYAPLYQFVDYICLIAKAPPPPHNILPIYGFNYRQIFDYHINRLGFEASREKLLNTFDKDYKTACERLSKYPTPPQTTLLPPTPPKIDIQAFTKNVEPYRISPPTLEQRLKKILDNIAWQPLVIFLCIASFIIALLAPDSPPPSTPTPNITLTTLANRAQVQATLTVRACLREPFTGTPSAPICSDVLTDGQKDNIIRALEIRETQSALQDSPTSCLIKGNISFDTGEKIYHLPGQKYYDSTTINPAYGERWFCTEAEAQAAGWRKSRE